MPVTLLETCNAHPQAAIWRPFYIAVGFSYPSKRNEIYWQSALENEPLDFSARFKIRGPDECSFNTIELSPVFKEYSDVDVDSDEKLDEIADLIVRVFLPGDLDES